MTTSEQPTQTDEHASLWLTPGELASWLSVVRLITRLPWALDAELQREADLSMVEYMTLANLSAAPEWTLRMSDLADYPLPHLDEAMPPAYGQYANDHTKDWAATIAGYDGYVFVTPEYNHSIPGVLKNALDYVYAEWNNKAAGFVSYGSLGGARAIEHLRAISSELQLAHVRQQVSFSLFSDFENFSTFKPGAQHDESVATLFDQLESWAGALKTVRG